MLDPHNMSQLQFNVCAVTMTARQLKLEVHHFFIQCYGLIDGYSIAKYYDLVFIYFVCYKHVQRYA